MDRRRVLLAGAAGPVGRLGVLPATFAAAGLGAARRAAAQGAAAAQSVSLSGSLGSRALLVIDGKPRQVAVGTTVDGVRLVSLSGGDAVVEIGGRRVTLPLGGAPVNLGGAPEAGTGSRIVLTADGAGHFVTRGSINGSSVQFMVDTGATNVALGQADADRIGLAWKTGTPAYSMTANGVVPIYKVSLNSVRVGDVQVHGIAGTVLPGFMPFVLLGNSFLSRFQMRRENDQLTLDRRY